MTLRLLTPSKGSSLWATCSSGNCSSQDQWCTFLVQRDNKIPKDSGGKGAEPRNGIFLPHTPTTSSYLAQKCQVSGFLGNSKFGRFAVKHWRAAFTGPGPQPEKPALWLISLLLRTLTTQSRKKASLASARCFSQMTWPLSSTLPILLESGSPAPWVFTPTWQSSTPPSR